MNNSLMLIVSVALLLLSPMVFAQTDAPNKQPVPNTATDTVQQDADNDREQASDEIDIEAGASSASPSAESTNAETTKTSKAKPEQKVFKPSEEISEDRPVPFPVDI